MKIVSIVGARPQFIKLALLSKEIRKSHTELILHTGQHYDYKMSGEFFNELEISKPDINLGIGSVSHAEQLAKMLIGIESYLNEVKPDLVLVYGDTNSTLAGALASTKIHIPVGHVEAGYRSFNRDMPEEINRIVTDHISALLFCTTKQTMEWLKIEGITEGIVFTGDLMFDSALYYGEKAESKSKVLSKLNLRGGDYVLATIHRSTNTDDPEKLKNILEALVESGQQIIFPLHPRTAGVIEKNNFKETIKGFKKIKLIDPVSYLDMLKLEKSAKKIVTDSGGVQKEAYFFQIPCITAREETESIETVEDGWNVLVGSNKRKIINSIRNFKPEKKQKKHYSDGQASMKISKSIDAFMRSH